MRARWFFAVVAICIYCSAPQCGAVAQETEVRYALSYPAANQFCPPTAGFFDEVRRTLDRVGGHTFRHQPNGGYGLPVVDKVGDANLIHLGADVGFYRVGEPVYAVANGVVRMSQGPLMDGGKTKRKDASKSGPKKTPVMGWGNLVVLEHQLPAGKYVTTIYGHLANDRLVKAGDIVQAGQQIGTIGATRVNGGYTPHLHLGVREGRLAEVGRKLLVMTLDGKPTALQISELHGDTLVLTGARDVPEQMTMGLDGRTFQLHKNGDKAEVNAALLYYVPSLEFMVVGYGLSADGWKDPIAFLSAHRADINPAPFVRAPRKRAAASVRRRSDVAATKDE